MKKIYMLMEDKWHPRDVILAGMEAALGKGAFTATVNPEEIPWTSLKDEAAVFVSQKGENQELPDGSKFKWITAEREKLLWDFVNSGGGALFIHCGIVLDDAGKQYRELAGGMFLQHPKALPVTCAPMTNTGHPIIQGVKPFTAQDEHYHCNVDITNVTPFMLACSEGNAATLAGWSREIGKGRTAALTPGHTTEAAADPSMAALIRNAVEWVTFKR